MVEDYCKSPHQLIKGLDAENPPSDLIFQNVLQPLKDWRERLWISRKSGVGFAAPGGNFTEAVYQCVKQGIIKPRAENLGRTVVLELGAGYFPYGYALAKLLGARGYIGVEPFYSDLLLARIREVVENETDPIPFSVVSQDMLSFLRRVPDRSISVFAFGIEQCILFDHEYRKNVESEITRVLDPLGSFLSYKSDLVIDGLQMRSVAKLGRREVVLTETFT